MTDDSHRLKVALGWLESHKKRLEVERRSVEERLIELTAEVERLGREIENARSRLREMTRNHTRPSGETP